MSIILSELGASEAKNEQSAMRRRVCDRGGGRQGGKNAGLTSDGPLYDIVAENME